MACLFSVVTAAIHILIFFSVNGQIVGSDMTKKVQNADMKITNLKSKILELERERASLSHQFRQSETRRVLNTNHTGVLEQDENSDVVTKLRNTDMDIIDLKSNLLALERDRVSLSHQHRKLVADNSVISDYIKTEVETTLDSILTDWQFQEMVSGLVREKLNALIKNFQILRRTVHVMSRRLRDFERDLAGCCNTKSETHVDTTNKLHHLDHVTPRLEKEVSDFKQLSVNGFDNVTSKQKTLEEDVGKIEEELTSLNHCLQTRLEMCQSKNASSYEATTLTPVTSLPPSRNMDLLTAPHADRKLVYFQRIDLHTRTRTNFPLRLLYVRSLLYVPSKRSVFFSTFNPNRISSIHVDSKVVYQIRKRLMVRGMALDENRQTVFLATDGRRKGIRTMDTESSSFRSLVYLTKYGSPRRLAVDPNRKMVYVCVGDRLLRVDYDGQTVKTLYMGSVFAVTLDLAGDLVYFTNGSKIIRKPLSSDETTNIVKVDFTVSDLVFYNNSVYIGSTLDGNVDVIHIGNKGKNIAYKRLQTVEHTSFSICLIPNDSN